MHTSELALACMQIPAADVLGATLESATLFRVWYCPLKSRQAAKAVRSVSWTLPLHATFALHRLSGCITSIWGWLCWWLHSVWWLACCVVLADSGMPESAPSL